MKAILVTTIDIALGVFKLDVAKPESGLIITCSSHEYYMCEEFQGYAGNADDILHM